jgi:hypothetical protein
MNNESQCVKFILISNIFHDAASVYRYPVTSLVYKFCWESPKEREHWEDQGMDGRMG